MDKTSVVITRLSCLEMDILQRTSMLYLLSVYFTVLHLCFGQERNISQQLSEGVSFLEPDSYLVSEPFSNGTSLLLRFTFQTSESNSLLVLSDSAGMGLSARLLDGAVFINDSIGGTNTFGSGLNNDRPHTLTIFHHADNQRFYYKLDDQAPILNSYAAGLKPMFGSNGFYFGRPSEAEGFPPYIGCLKDILYSNGSGLNDLQPVNVASSNLQDVTVMKSVGGAFGECTQCAGVDCGNGTCAVRWLPPVTTFCDCRASSLVGPSCSEGEMLSHV